jgi:hypothetical protein
MGCSRGNRNVSVQVSHRSYVTECGYCNRLSSADVSSEMFLESRADASGNARDTSGMRILAEVSYEMFLEPSMLMLVERARRVAT